MIPFTGDTDAMIGLLNENTEVNVASDSPTVRTIFPDPASDVADEMHTIELNDVHVDASQVVLPRSALMVWSFCP